MSPSTVQSKRAIECLSYRISSPSILGTHHVHRTQHPTTRLIPFRDDAQEKVTTFIFLAWEVSSNRYILAFRTNFTSDLRSVTSSLITRRQIRSPIQSNILGSIKCRPRLLSSLAIGSSTGIKIYVTERRSFYKYATVVMSDRILHFCSHGVARNDTNSDRHLF